MFQYVKERESRIQSGKTRFLALLRRLRFSSEAQRSLANLLPASRGLRVQN